MPKTTSVTPTAILKNMMMSPLSPLVDNAGSIQGQSSVEVLLKLWNSGSPLTSG